MQNVSAYTAEEIYEELMLLGGQMFLSPGKHQAAHELEQVGKIRVYQKWGGWYWDTVAEALPCMDYGLTLSDFDYIPFGDHNQYAVQFTSVQRVSTHKRWIKLDDDCYRLDPSWCCPGTSVYLDRDGRKQWQIRLNNTNRHNRRVVTSRKSYGLATAKRHAEYYCWLREWLDMVGIIFDEQD